MEEGKPTPLKWLKLTADQMKATGEFLIQDLDQITGKFLTESALLELQSSDYRVKMISRRVVKDFEMVTDRAISMLQVLRTQMQMEAQESFIMFQAAKVTRGTSVSLPNCGGNGLSVNGVTKATGGALEMIEMKPKSGITTQEDRPSAREGKSFGIQIKPMGASMSQEAPKDSNDVSTMTCEVQLVSTSTSTSAADSESNRTLGKECPAENTSISGEEGTSDAGQEALGRSKSEGIIEGNEAKETIQQRRKSPRGHVPPEPTPVGLFARKGPYVKKIKLEKDSQEWLQE